jgi:hypothetical protein
MNPLLDLKLPWWENYVLSKAFGTNWKVTVWAKLTAALDGYIAGPGQTVASFVTSKLDNLVAEFLSGEPFIAGMVEGSVNVFLPMLITAAEAYVESKVDVGGAKDVVSSAVFPPTTLTSGLGYVPPDSTPPEVGDSHLPASLRHELGG